jgi:hypothetical protein
MFTYCLMLDSFSLDAVYCLAYSSQLAFLKKQVLLSVECHSVRIRLIVSQGIIKWIYPSLVFQENGSYV